MAEPARKIQLEREETTRPRDAAIRRIAANDNVPVPKQDNVYRLGMRQTVDEEFTRKYQDAGVQPTLKVQTDTKASNDNEATISRFQAQQNIQRVEEIYAEQVAATTPSPSQVAKTLEADSAAAEPAKDAALVAIAESVGAANKAWGLALYAGIQVPLATLNLAFFGMTYAIKTITGSDDGGFVSQLIDGAMKTINALSVTLLGFDFTILDPANLFYATLFLVMLVGASTLLIMGITYQIAGIHCLFGRGTSVKSSTFIIALMGYMLPLVNLAPCFLIWNWAVTKYPR